MAVKDSANYKPSIWNYDYIQSLNSPYLNETYGERSKKLKGQVKDMLAETSSTFEQLELLDVSSRLGISYHFKYEICQITELIYASLDAQYYPNKTNDDQALDLYATALKFRVLRENGHQVSQEIFRPFLNNNGDLKSSLCKDVKSLLSLYEASYLSLQDESILDLAQDFTVRYLKESLARNECQGHLAILVKHALDLPLNWRMQRLETKWFIKMYEKMESMNPILLELAILDFNMVQAKYQEEIKELSGWYVETGLAEKLPFARDRLFENFLWALAVAPEPQLEHCRKTFTKVAVLILIVDDIYDEYGTLDELELFTDVINRWDITAVNQLPDYMKICFMALFKCVNEVAHDIPTEQGVNVIPCLEKMWAKICSSYLVEARWLSQNYTPSLNEYLLNGWTTSTGPIITVHIFLGIINPIRQEALQDLEQLIDSIQAPSMIIRLLDDLRSSIAHGDNKVDTPKAVECYISDTGATKEDAYIYIRGLINELWKQLNMNLLSNNRFIKDFNEIGKKFVRVARCYGDAHATPESEVIALVAHPIPLH